MLTPKTSESEPALSRPEPLSNSRVLRVPQLIVNSYLVGDVGASEWALVDTGLAPFSASRIISAAAKRFGKGVKPSVIVLTHGHFDHVGAVERLARFWNVQVYAHELELPYLTGRSAYPPPDPTVGGGLMARLAGFYPRKPIDLGPRVHALPADGLVPGLPGWRWLHTPGHSPGHISLFRFSDGILIAGDAFVTTRQESLLSVLTQRQVVSRPPAYFTPNWGAARRSLQTLLTLQPEVAATGHGIPMTGQKLRQQLRDLVENFENALPARGRYLYEPAVADESGVVSLPAPVSDPVPRFLAVGAASLALFAVVAVIARQRQAKAATR